MVYQPYAGLHLKMCQNSLGGYTLVAFSNAKGAKVWVLVFIKPLLLDISLGTAKKTPRKIITDIRFIFRSICSYKLKSLLEKYQFKEYVITVTSFILKGEYV